MLQISAELEWIAEFLPWGSDGLLRTRSRNAPENFDAPTGGFFWNGRDVVILRRKFEDRESVESELEKALRGGDLESCRTLLEESGKALGRFHKSMSNIRNLPPDQKRWNARNEKIEGLLRAQFIWRAPYTKGATLYSNPDGCEIFRFQWRINSYKRPQTIRCTGSA